VAAAPDLARLRTTLASSGAAPDGVAVDASVMVCLREGPSGPEVLLCRRAQRPGDPWSGHIALPGGRVEPGDRDSLATAARETREEVGFDPLAHGVLLGALEPLVPRSLPIAVAAHVVVVERPVELVLSDELAAAWWTPFAELRPTRAEVAEVPAPVSAWRLPHEDAGDVVLWGITYRILRRLLDAAR
jgi:8-oxo-dGTP pyrophosphatase MutT (NUDIX family)